MAKAKELPATEAFELTPEEREAILALRQKGPALASGNIPMAGVQDLAAALVMAIEQTRPPQKKNPFNRTKICKTCGKHPNTHVKLVRAWYQHGGIELDPKIFCNETIELLNKVKPGIYCKGIVRVTKRKDRSYDISWPVRTAAQRLRVMNEAGNTFEAILQRCIDEHADPKKFKGPDDLDDE